MKLDAYNVLPPVQQYPKFFFIIKVAMVHQLDAVVKNSKRINAAVPEVAAAVEAHVLSYQDAKTVRSKPKVNVADNLVVPTNVLMDFHNHANLAKSSSKRMEIVRFLNVRNF